MSLDDKTLFLAGAAGMTGSSILRHLVDLYPSARVVASHLRTPPALCAGNVRWVQADLRSVEQCRQAIRGCDTAIMSAAYAGGAGYTTVSYLEHTRENLLMNWSFLEACHIEKVRRVIFIGSAAMYQPFDGHIREDQLRMDQDPYPSYHGFGWAMRFLERILWHLHYVHGMEAIAIRAANIYGPRDKFDATRSNFIPAIIRKAVDRLDPFEVWGSPDVVRDVIYCDDFARAVIMLTAADHIKFDVFNVGSGLQTTVGQVVQAALQATGHKPNLGVVYRQDRPTTIRFRALDCTKVQGAVGWRPRVDLGEGIRQTTQWWIENRSTWTR